MNPNIELHETQLAYWKKELAGAPMMLELPIDKPRTAVQTFRGATEAFALPKELIGELKSIGSKEQATLFIVLVAAYMALLHRYTRQDDILVGIPIESESIIGSGRNTVVLRALFTDDLNFRSLLQQVRERSAGAYSHADVHFEQVEAELALDRDSSRAPIFQAIFAFHDAEGTSQAPIASGSRRPGTGTSRVDLSLSISESENGFEGSVEYNSELFETTTIRRLCGHYRTLLEGIARDPNQSISSLPMLSESERTKILYEWNDTGTEYPKACVHELFEQQVARTPDAIAVIFEQQQLSYRELNQRANQVAHYLRRKGIGPEDLVGVCLERCPEMLIGLLGIWKAGGAYVPLDPAYPKARLSFMLEDAAAKILLTDGKHAVLFSSAKDKAILIDSDWPAIAKENTANISPVASPSNLAYVMYTSGSTGEPKGVMILHMGLANYLCWAVKAYAVGPGDAVPVHTSISFDLTVTGLYPALLAGGKVEILAEDVGGQNLVAALRNGKDRSLVKITPAHLLLLGQQFRQEEVSQRTKLFVIGGENLVTENLLLWRDFAPATRLINEYGPTETVVGCCVYEVGADDPRSGSVPIGRPIANTQLYILDRSMNPVLPGVVGELFIGGDGVARGYLNRPELTKQKFIPDPFSSRSGARLYRTGDLARYRKDGVLEYLGRVDNQVKVRGYRIELGEIEATLAEHTEVKSCAVLAREDTPGNKQLVGYVVSRGEERPTTEMMRQFLKEKLPEYMVPAQFVFLDSMPLTLNGKIDQKALPLPSHDNASNGQKSDGPRNETEKALAAIWEDLLKTDHVGINIDLFNLGADSLIAIRAISRIRDVFGVDLPAQTLFEKPTIAELAIALAEALA
jgi:amino acid adenylation domain-containing protein